MVAWWATCQFSQRQLKSEWLSIYSTKMQGVDSESRFITTRLATWVDKFLVKLFKASMSGACCLISRTVIGSSLVRFLSTARWVWCDIKWLVLESHGHRPIVTDLGINLIVQDDTCFDSSLVRQTLIHPEISLVIEHYILLYLSTFKNCCWFSNLKKLNITAAMPHG